MKIYLDLQKQAITKTTDENIYQGDIYSNVFEILFYNYTDSNWFPTMSQLAPNGRKAGEFTADALDVGESHEYTEDGVTYLKFDFTMGTSWVLMKGRSEFYIWFNRLGGAIVQKKCVGVVNVMIDHSTEDYFIADPTFNPNVKAYIDACIAELGDGSPKYFDTASNIANLTEDKGLAVATDTGHLYYWDETKNSTTKYTDSGLVYNDLSAYYTKTEVDNTFAKKSANNTFTGNNTFNGETTFTNDIEIGGGDINQINGGYSTNGNVEAQSMTIDGVNLENLFADKTTTYTIPQTDALLDSKADKSNTYTIPETNTLLDGKQNVLTFDSTPIANSTNPVTSGGVKTALDAKADSTTVSGIDNRVGALENEITDLQSVQNVVDVVATKSALNSYDTSKLEENDKIQVIADETHDGASTVYNWNGSAWQYVGAYGTNSYTKAQTYTKTETLEQIDLHKLVNKTYSELATLKSGNNLVPGQLYRITDYVTLTNGMCNNVGNDARSAQHPFDIIVRATATNKFSEQARAIWHSGDTYFANSELQAWQLWYCFDNDSTRFEWADTSTGKGVIYRMIDEFGNDLPYDFKNIQFKRYKITATSDQRQILLVGKYLGFADNYGVTSDNTDYQWYYTFSKRTDGSDLSLTETKGTSYNNSYFVKQVKMGTYLCDTPNYRGVQSLNNIVMEADNIIVDVQMGVGSHHNTWIGNKDIDYCYFREMFRQNILFGEINHTRADECFEQNVLGEGHYSNYSSCWNKFSHHFSRNTALNLQSNDFEGQVGNCKFPEHFTRNFVSNMWDNVNAGTHDTFNRCEFGYMVNVTLSGAGDWDGVKTIMCYNVTIKIANLYGSTVGRMEYVTITEDVNTFKILNLTIGALNGSSSTQLTIALTDLYSYNLTTAYEKRLNYALAPINNLRVLVYSVKIKGTYIVQDKCVVGNIIASTGNVTWALANTIEERIDAVYDGLFNTKMAKQNPTGRGSISMNDGTASGTNSYANGSGATASGNFSRAIGFGAQASGNYSTSVHGTASGDDSVAYGNLANASGNGSFALGTQCKAKGNNQVVTGKFNIPDTDSLEIVGNGAYMNTQNARLLDANGNEYLKGDIYVNSTFTKDANGDLDTKSGTKLVAVSANPTLAGTEADLTGLEVDGTKYKVSSGGGTTTLDDIVDSAGNKRFIEGDGVETTITNLSISYKKWSLSGTHLMIVYAGGTSYTVSFSANQKLIEYTLPEYVSDKIYPVWSDNLILTNMYFIDDGGSTAETMKVLVKKDNNKLVIQNTQAWDVSGTTHFRFQFDLLIDAD